MIADLRNGDCLEVLKTLPTASVDAVVTDPPAGIAFMGKAWDRYAERLAFVDFMTGVMAEALRVLKPGGHALVWALPRTSHWTATAIEDAGFEVRDVITHHFGSGFPKSLDASKAIDKAAGAEREVVGLAKGAGMTRRALERFRDDAWKPAGPDLPITAPATENARRWSGWGTALKPASEHWILARKPLGEATVAANVIKHGTGALNIDASRIAGSVPQTTHGVSSRQGEVYGKFREEPEPSTVNSLGRFPANLILSHSAECAEACAPDCPVDEMDRQSGPSTSKAGGTNSAALGRMNDDDWKPTSTPRQSPTDSGGASRFFYVPKASTRERNEGLDGFEKKNPFDRGGPSRNFEKAGSLSQPRQNHHPTVKPIALMRYLCRLVTPPGGLVLDPFMGSGSTGVAAILEDFRFLGIERETDYFAIAQARIARVLPSEPEPEPVKLGQMTIFGGPS